MMPHPANNPPAGAPINPDNPIMASLHGRGPDVAAVLAGLQRLYQVAGFSPATRTALATDLAVHVRLDVTVDPGLPTPEGREPATGQRHDRAYLADALRVLLEPTQDSGTPMPVTVPELVATCRLLDLVAALYAGEPLGQVARTLSARLRRRANGATS